MEFFKFYVSSFWIWAGITFGAVMILEALVGIFKCNKSEEE